MSNETSIKNHRPSIGGPPVLTLSASRNWSLDIVIYPSGFFLELVELVPECGAKLVYSERLDNLIVAAQKLREKAECISTKQH
jgi:hypothetical protein